MSSHRFLVTADDLERARVDLRGAELRHLRARRLAAGDEIVLTDGCGGERNATIVSVGRAAAILQVQAASVPRSVESPLGLTLAQAALKADKLDLVVEKATELGVTDIIIYTSSRCIAKPGAEKLQRWERLARSAAKQCQRTRIPSIRGPLAFTDVLVESRQSLRLLFWEGSPAGGGLATSRLGDHETVLAMVGPEGGFAPEEVAAGRAEGFEIVGLGPRILRAETAAIVAVTTCQSLWGDLRRASDS